MIKDVNLEIYLKIFKSKDEVTTGSIVSSDNRYYIVTGGVMSNKYERYVYYCRQLSTNQTKIFSKDQLEVVTFNTDVFEKGKCLGTYTIDADSIEKIDYTTKPQTVRGHIAIYKCKVNVGDKTVYPMEGTISSIVGSSIFITDDKGFTNEFSRSYITLASKDCITSLRLVCPKCGK